jgi:DNA-binding SARP family transcriptional activator/tetratricopeptide (TPR) repeat protein
MIEFHTLGGLDLRDPLGAKLSVVLAHPKRTALLAYLAVATPRGFHRRDALVALFWPELDQEHARASLRKAVYHLRRALGEDVLVGAGDDELGLAPSRLWCDASAFEHALDAGDLPHALELYRGPLLTGFFVADAPDFERWLERERTRFRDRAFDAMWRLADQEAQANHALEAALWGRRAAALVPDDEGALRRLVVLLDAVSDRAGAVSAYEDFARRLREDYDVEPSAETQALVRSVRSRNGSAGADRTPVPHATVRPAVATLATGPAAGEVSSAEGPGLEPIAPAPRSLMAPAGVGDAQTPNSRPETPFPQPPIAPAHLPAPRAPGWAPGRGPRAASQYGWRRKAGRVLLAALTLATLAGVWRLWRQTGPARQSELAAAIPLSSTSVAVLPFTFHGSADFEYLAEGMASLLGTSLDGVGGLHAVDPSSLLAVAAPRVRAPLDPSEAAQLATRAGAGLYILGDVVEVDGRLRASAALYDARRGPRAIARAAVEDSASQLFGLVDRLAGQLVADQGTGPDARLTRLAAVTTHSLPALRAYLDGEKQFRIGHYKEAVAAFQSAVAEDTTFALAYYRLASAYSWSSDTMARPSAVQATRFAQRLSTPDRLLVEAYLPFVNGDADDAERRYRAILATRPFEGEAWYPLGEVLFHYNPLRGRPIAEARPMFQRALTLGPKDSPLTHLLEIEAIERNYRVFDSLLPGIAPGAHFDLVGRMVRAFTSGSEVERTRILAEIRALPDPELANVGRHVLFLLEDRAGGARVLRLLLEPTRPREVRAQGYILLAHLEMAAGRWRAADSALTAAEPLDQVRALEHRGLLLVLPLPLPPSAREAARAALERTMAGAADVPGLVFRADDRLHRVFGRYLLGLLEADRGRYAAAERFATEIMQLPQAPEAQAIAPALGRGLRARIAWERGQPAAALTELQHARIAPTNTDLLGVVPFFSLAPERFLRAEALHALGRDVEALGWYGAFGEHSAFARVYLAPAHRRQAEIYQKLGRHDDAVRHLERFVELWEDADPELRALVDDARARLERLRGEAAARGAPAAGPRR